MTCFRRYLCFTACFTLKAEGRQPNFLQVLSKVSLACGLFNSELSVMFIPQEFNGTEVG